MHVLFAYGSYNFLYVSTYLEFTGYFAVLYSSFSVTFLYWSFSLLVFVSNFLVIFILYIEVSSVSNLAADAVFLVP
jgi:hypothetical protein